MSTDINDFNARWLKAWSEKDVDALLTFYASDTRYFDPQVPDGIQGHDALRAYLQGLFDATPPMHYEPHEVWATDNGYCGRWYCTVSGEGDEKSLMRGFDLVVLKDGLIALNEVYVHPVTEIAATA